MVVAVVMFVSSYFYMRWRHCTSWVKRHVGQKSGYDYKNIFKHYLSHINSIDNKRALYEAILKVVGEIVSSDDVSLLLKDEGAFVIKDYIGARPATFQADGIEGFLSWMGKFRRTVSRYQFVNRKEYAKVKGDGLHYCVQFHCEACVPLFSGGELLGIINIGSRSSGEIYDAAIRELLDFLAGQMAVSIHNASLYEDLVRRNVKLQEVGKLKNQLLSNINHEFRTPLNGIIGLSEVMMEGCDGPVTDEQKAHLKMIADSSRRLMDTVAAMIDLAKLEANHLQLNVKRLSLYKMFSKAIEDVKPVASNATSLKLSFNGDTPPVYGDEDWLNKLFGHVLSNAVKYTPNGEIVVGVEKSGEMLKVGVHDTGIGVDPEKQKTIFESFSQASSGADRDYEGAGVGLAIAKKVVDLHGGRIWLSSAPGKGSHFFFTLPLKPTGLRSIELKQ